MTAPLPTENAQEIKAALCTAEIVMNNLPERPGYNGSVLSIDDVEASDIANTISEAGDHIASLEHQLAEARKDAARYRHIRSHAGFNLNNDMQIGNFEVSQKTRNGEATMYYEDALDTAI